MVVYTDQVLSFSQGNKCDAALKNLNAIPLLTLRFFLLFHSLFSIFKMTPPFPPLLSVSKLDTCSLFFYRLSNFPSKTLRLVDGWFSVSMDLNSLDENSIMPVPFTKFYCSNGFLSKWGHMSICARSSNVCENHGGDLRFEITLDTRTLLHYISF